MKYLIALLMFSNACYANWEEDVKKEKSEAAAFINGLPEYACFTQVYQFSAELPWEIGGIKEDKAYMVIRKASNGFLFAQPVPDCEKRNSCGYWIRSTTYSGNVWTHNLKKVPCPSKLTREFVVDLIKKEYSNDYRLSY